jgi:redox-sensitive bicupin YhaK (pirin superfamily)
VCELDAGRSVTLLIATGRQAYVVCAEGSAELTGGKGAPVVLARHEAVRVAADGPLVITAGDNKAHVLLLEMRAGR